MKKLLLSISFFVFLSTLHGQIIRSFQLDTASYIDELVEFTGLTLQTDEVPDFERFVRVFDSIEYERQMEIIEVSNLMLQRKCRPRPQFITYQRILMEFFTEDKMHHGYDEWMEGFKQFLGTDRALLRTINQWLTLNLTLLDEEIFYSSNAVLWKCNEPSYTFRTDEQLVIEFDKVDVACYSGREFIQIFDASGYVDPLDMEWVGSRGKVNWERVNKAESEMVAELSNYRINLRKPSYTADSVIFHYPSLFNEPVLGQLEDKVSQVRNVSDIRYPQFNSYQDFYRINDFMPEVNYMGGVAIEGATLVGKGGAGRLASLEIFSEDTLRVWAKSERILMNEKQIRSPNTEVSLYLGEDSIYHPDLVFSYDAAKEEMRLNKSDGFTSQGPYSNSYHGIDMNYDELFWKKGEARVALQGIQGSAIGRATFESNTFFNMDFFMSLQGMDYVHPLGQLAAYSKVVRSRSFYSGPYSDYAGFAEYQIRHQLMALAKLGFVYFDDETSEIILRQKLFDYMAASTQRRDYDVIRFNSRTDGSVNGILNIESKDLTIHGIPVIFLSDSQNVRLVPRNNMITMQKNRSFSFDGVVDAGLFRFTGRNFYFNYELFMIDLENIDSLQLSIRTGQVNEYGEQLLTQIDNVMEQMTGELFIDEPMNKSGLKSYPGFPSFSSRGNAFIFFDRPSIQNGVYDRERFYFELDPFSIDSLDNFEARSISPSGTFMSAGILPPLEMDMTLREDNSLGFYMKTPEEGIDLYGGSATFYNDIEMSSRGLHAYGSMDYLSSTTWSDDFLLHPDSLMTRSRRYLLREVAEGSAFPYAENTETDVTYYAMKDSMVLAKVEENFKIFSDSVWHSGSLGLSPTGLAGSGVTATGEARFESDNFSYRTSEIYADSAGVQLRAAREDDFSFATDNVGIHVDLETRKGNFVAREGRTEADMSYIMYKTELESMTWDMDDGTIAMSKSGTGGRRLAGTGLDSLIVPGSPLFISTHPQQEELSFTSSEAIYDYKARQLDATKVPFISVADAYVFPDSGQVRIRQQATMDTLYNARLMANQRSRKHQMYDGTIIVRGARDYGGSATYNYRDAYGTDYRIRFNRIWVDSTYVTRSRGEVEEDDDFMISPHYDFQGEVFLSADKDFLDFDGGVRLIHDCPINRAWMRFTTEIDPSNIRIPVAEAMVNTNLNKIFAGSLITRDSTHIYSAFLSSRKDYFDANITTAHGTLIYDQENASYLIAQEDKLSNPARPGNYLRLETENCLLYGEGPINLNLDYGQVKLTAAGSASHQLEADRFEARLALGIDFMFSEQALTVMGGELDSLPDLEPADMGDPHYQLAVRDLVGVEQAGKLQQQLSLTGAYESLPPGMDQTLFFSDIPLRWDQETRSFRYKGKVSIGHIGNIQVNKKVDAYVSLVERGSGDVFDIYLRADNNTWYYIAYSPGGLQVLSSNKAFNDIVYNLKANERRIKGKPGQAPYVYSLAAQRRLDLFLDRFEFEEGE